MKWKEERFANDLAFLNEGLSLVPVCLDGTKKPPKERWKQYQTERADEATLRRWLDSGYGIAIVCGEISGGLEVLDFDECAETIFPDWRTKVEPILDRLPVVETPGNGYHVYFRCDYSCPGVKIAQSNSGAVLIESRGVGNRIISVTNPPEIHRNHMEYMQVAGPVLPDIPPVSRSERLELWKHASEFDRSGIVERRVGNLKPAGSSFRGYQASSGKLDRARKYISKMPPAISGSGGHNQTFKVAKVVFEKFQLKADEAFLLLTEYNERCVPPWSEHELLHKVRSAQ
jgi:hypothetical protein